MKKTIKFSFSSSRLLLALFVTVFVIMMLGEMIEALKAGKYFVTCLDIAMVMGIVHQWWTVWTEQIN